VTEPPRSTPPHDAPSPTAGTEATPGTSLVRLDGVSKSYRLGDGSILTAARDVTLEILAGQRVAMVGASGSGKSTLLHLIGAIDTPDSGTISVGGQVVTGLSGRRLADYRAGIGFVFQQFNLVPGLSLLDNVAAPLVGRKVSDDKWARARELLDAVGLAGRERSLPSQLSGGQQQRVAIARALVVRPSLLLADEPTGNLDSSNAEAIMDLLLELQHRYGATIVLATHDAALAATCDQVYEIRDGVVTEGPLPAVLPPRALARRAMDGEPWN